MLQLVKKVCFFKKSAYSQSLSPNPFPRKGAECGAAALTPLGATPKARTLWLLAKSFARCKTNIASNAKHPFLKLCRFFDRLKHGGFSPCFFISLSALRLWRKVSILPYLLSAPQVWHNVFSLPSPPKNILRQCRRWFPLTPSSLKLSCR